MAIRNEETVTTKGFKPADAFLKLEVIPKSGSAVKIPKDLPLHLDKLVMRSMINAAQKGLENGVEVEFTLKGTVYIPTVEAEQDDIQF